MTRMIGRPQDPSAAKLYSKQKLVMLLSNLSEIEGIRLVRKTGLSLDYHDHVGPDTEGILVCFHIRSLGGDVELIAAVWLSLSF